MARRRGVHVEVEGVEDLRRAFAKLEVASLREAKAVVRESALDMEGEALGRADWQDDTGDTRRSIKTIIRDGGLSATVGSGYFKARFHEFGTINMVARPFLTPAFEIVRPQYIERLAAALNKAARGASVG